ncbi:MAG: nuclear transport factor 2 family protein [Pyrinomonadaceae bacterium]
MAAENPKLIIKNGEIIKNLYENVATLNIPAVLNSMDPNISWTEAEGYMYGGTYVGPEAILENVFKRLTEEWEDFRAEPERIVDGGNTVVALGTYSGKYLKTGRSMTAPFAHVWRFKNQRISEFVQYTDTLVIARMLGLENQ